MDGLEVTSDLTIPESELTWVFSTSGGPGGQHANRSATRAILSWDVAGSFVLAPVQRERLLGRLGSRLDDGVIVIGADETRSQWRNRQIARSRLAELVRDALRPDPPRRRRTRPSAAQRRRRREWKRRRSQTKRLRRPPRED